MEEICVREKEIQNINDIRPSVNTIADVKMGELLETSYQSIYYSIVGNDKCECLKNIGFEQSAAKILGWKTE